MRGVRPDDASSPSAAVHGSSGVRHYQRYVAIGDSTSEGLDDPDGRGGYRGWANRFAEHVARVQGGLLYANLAVRGRRTREILEQQLEPALSLRPDLCTVVSGVNDLLRPRFSADEFGGDLEQMQRAFTATGATVLTFTLPSLSKVLPLARRLESRVRAMNEAVREACRSSGAILVDFAAYEDVGSDPRLWSDDRLHANALGHARIADGLAHAIDLPGSSADWRVPLPPARQPRLWTVIGAEARWWQSHFLPWVWRHALGRSSGDGRQPKRPALHPVELTDGGAA
ncbi:MAG: SGNH/GDSL hydrolase family protein [Gemmatimonadaceae bacterium]